MFERPVRTGRLPRSQARAIESGRLLHIYLYIYIEREKLIISSVSVDYPFFLHLLENPRESFLRLNFSPVVAVQVFIDRFISVTEVYIRLMSVIEGKERPFVGCNLFPSVFAFLRFVFILVSPVSRSRSCFSPRHPYTHWCPARA